MNRVHCLKAAEPKQEQNVLLTTKSPGKPGTHFIDFGRMMDWAHLVAN